MRSIATSFAVLGAVLLFAACNSSSGDDSPSYGGSWSDYSYCRQYTSCGTCTPVDGCGWCFDADGQGECVSGPDQCSSQTFTWTWNSSGCRVAADASTGPVVVGDDGATTIPPVLDAAVTEDAAPGDGGAPAADAQPLDGGAAP
jgi:hypothetical protein